MRSQSSQLRVEEWVDKEIAFGQELSLWIELRVSAAVF